MEWSKGKKIKRGSRGQFGTHESVSGEYRVTPDAGGRFHAYHKDVKISKRGMSRVEAQSVCETHAGEEETPPQTFVANVPPAEQETAPTRQFFNVENTGPTSANHDDNGTNP